MKEKECKSCKIEKVHHHETEKKENAIGAKLYVISILLFLLTWLPLSENVKVLLYILAILSGGYDLLWKGIKNIVQWNFTEDTLMTIAVLSAFALGEYPESILVVLLYKLGELMEERATQRSMGNIDEILKIKADTANVLDEEEKITVLPVEKVKVGEHVLIKPGEKVPLDGKVKKGTSSLDTSNITGESKPMEVEPGNTIFSGSINLSGPLIMEVIKDDKDSTVSQIVDLVYEATNNKGETEKFITKFSKVYTPTVVVLAILIAVLPPCFGYLDMRTWFYRSLVFLVASCPCSIVISVPLAFFSCIGAISKKGLIVKGTKHIENISKATAIAFDKTGTLTTGKMEIDTIVALDPYSKEEVITYLASLERFSNHPIANAVTQMAKEKPIVELTKVKEIAGHGIYGEMQEKQLVLGNRKMLDRYHVTGDFPEGNAIYLGINGKLAGYMVLREELREESKDIVHQLKKVNIDKTIMLTGDNKKAAEKLGKQIGFTQVHSELLPAQKREVVEQLKKKDTVIFVGDGINDSPVLASSDFGIAMGAGTQIAGNVADSILLSNNIGKIPQITQIARRTMNVVKVNIIFSLFIKSIVLLLGFLGVAPIWLAILADTGVTFITVLNSIRIFRF